MEPSVLSTAAYRETAPFSLKGAAPMNLNWKTILKKAGIIQSIRGAQGGYVLAKELEEVSVGEVLRALEGDLNPVECSGFLLEGGCQAADNCVTKYVWQRINDSINQTVDEMNLKALVEVGENLKESKADQTCVSNRDCRK